MNTTYVVHDLVDPAVSRRVSMMERGGAKITLVGFRRSVDVPREVAGLKPIDLGRTYPAALVKRTLSVFRAILRVRSLAESFTGAELVIARNLECLAIAALARRLYCRQARLFYECLDIHRTMLNTGIKGKVLRWLERRLLAASDAVIVSSSAFAEQYFKPLQGYIGPIVLIENKVFGEGKSRSVGRLDRANVNAENPIWRIGWFGVIRCQKSLDLLTQLAASLEGRVEIIIRGRVASHEFRDFHGQVESSPHVQFAGPYKNPDDLAEIYGDVHFAWAIDYFEAGQNSAWLLPNRIYESGSEGAVAIADRNVETGRWLAEKGIGVLLDEITPATLGAFFNTLTKKQWLDLRSAVLGLPEETFVVTDGACVQLMADLASLKLRG